MRHALSETLSGLRRHAGMTVAIIVTMAVSLSLLGVGLLSAQQVDLIKGRWYDRVEITLFLCAPDSSGENCTPGKDISGEERDAVRAALTAHPEVSEVFYQGKEEVFVEFAQAYSDSPILDSMTARDMQEVFRIKLVDPRNYEGVVSMAAALPGVQAVQDLRGVLDPLFGALEVARWATLGASALLLLAAALQISNTIRMAASSRRRELGIMRLVGASRTYIVLPFLLESLLAALVGAALACLSLAALQEFAIVRKAQPALQGVPLIDWSHVLNAMLGLVMVAVLLSIVPTLTATRRHLKD